MEPDGKGTPCQQDGNSPDNQTQGYSGTKLPEDIWCYIRSLMPMRDAAQFACVARAFVCSWRRHPNLDFSEETIQNRCRKDENARDFNSKVDRILKNHSGIGVKVFKFHVPSVYNEDSCHLDRLDSWLQIADKSGIKEPRLILTMDEKYNFPCSLLSGIKMETLSGVFFWHVVTFIPQYCNNIVCLKIPCLQQLSYLEVICCTGLKAIERKAPNLSSVWVAGDLHVQLSLENTCRVKILNRHCSNFAFYARTNLPSIMPNLEALSIYSFIEMVNKPTVPSKFLHLKFLRIAVGGLTFDFLSLASFLDASPSLETFILEVIRELKERVSVFEDPSDMRAMPGHHHSRIKHVKIIKFSAAKSVAE
ncbi:hypothetical protein BAE44_0012217 [Dichanthelium oligosanthes]|uniref:At1g61320/AtMIF1 LRR domain-containing protein n=1 Tax=Dichanthelium oligosanthes TaxID=888268 RepID=A0A1E5VNQ6_9POAL|nr:hypothetical protein BAE44_0012217 [Dichanthelium oligosanthes]